MIQRIQYSPINFKGDNTQAPQQVQEVVKTEVNEEIAPQENKTKSFSVTQTYTKAKKSVLNFLKGFNNVKGVSTGVAKGVAEGAIASAVIGIVGKNCKNGEGKIIATGKGILTDVWNIVKFLPKTAYNVLWAKSPKDNLKSLGASIKKGLKELPKGMKKHRLTATIAIVAGLGIAGFKTLQGKIRANEQNADLDHKTNYGHIK